MGFEETVTKIVEIAEGIFDVIKTVDDVVKIFSPDDQK